ncbi:MAG: hypothetical protein L6R43_09070 [Planctomycetes bacterium]|nr:hypothetical protein [Planctomycetota bacterium]
MNETPTARDILHSEAVNLATDVAGLLLEYRDRVGAEEAFAIASEILSLSHHVLRARRSVVSAKARDHFAAARTVCQRAMVALERFAARSRIPLMKSAGLHSRLSSLSCALGALAEGPRW